MAHIHTNPGEHDFTASAFIIRFDTPQPQLLLHMHKKHKTLMQPGGHVETTENVWQGALRETAEETGYSKNQLEVFQPSTRMKVLKDSLLHPVPAVMSTHPIPSEIKHSHIDAAFAFAVAADPIQALHPEESQLLRWVTLPELKNLSDTEIIPNVRDISIFVMTTIVSTWERVPVSEFQS